MTGAWNTKSCRVHQARGNESVEKHVRRASAEPRRVHPNQGVHDDGQIGDTEANEEPVHDADLLRQTVGTRTPGAAIIGFRMMESSAAPPRETGCGNAGAPPARGGRKRAGTTHGDEARWQNQSSDGSAQSQANLILRSVNGSDQRKSPNDSASRPRPVGEPRTARGCGAAQQVAILESWPGPNREPTRWR